MAIDRQKYERLKQTVEAKLAEQNNPVISTTHTPKKKTPSKKKSRAVSIRKPENKELVRIDTKPELIHAETTLYAPLPVRQEVASTFLHSLPRYTTALFAMSCALVLMYLEIEMGMSTPITRARGETDQMLWLRLNQVVALLTCGLLCIADQLWKHCQYVASALAVVLWLAVCLPLSLYNVQAFVSQNLADILAMRTQASTPEMAQLEERYRTVLRQSQDECSTGRKGVQRGDSCHKLEGDAAELFTKLEAKRAEVKQDTIIDPANASVARILSAIPYLHLNPSIEDVRVLVIILIMILVPIGSGVVFMVGVKLLVSERRYA